MIGRTAQYRYKATDDSPRLSTIRKFLSSPVFKAGTPIRIIYCLLLFIPLNVYGQQVIQLRKEIDKIIRHETDPALRNVHGFIIGIIDGDSTYILPYGSQSSDSGDELTADDVFEIGSITKTMTAEIILRLDAEDILDVDDPLNKFVPEQFINPACEATLRDILLHHGGLPKLPEVLGATQEDFNSPYSGFPREDLLGWYREMKPGMRGTFRYSHTGFALLEIVIEEATGASYAEAFDHYISHSYGMQRTHAIHREPLTPGHDLAGRQAAAWVFQSFQASEGAQSNLSDLVIYLRAMMGNGSFPLSWDYSLPASGRKLRIIPGWYQYLPKKNFPVYIHTGRTSGHSTMIAFTKKTDTGVVILANASAGTDDLGLLILRMINKQWRRK